MQLGDLYENDSIFDKFECCLSGDGSRVATGSYRCVDFFFFFLSFCFSTNVIYFSTNNFYYFSNLFRVFGCAAGSTEETTLEASKNPR